MALDPEIQAQQEALRAEIANLGMAIRQQTTMLTGMTGSVQRATNELNKVKIEEDYGKLANSIRVNNVSVADATSQLVQLDKAATESGSALSQQAIASREVIVSNLRASVATKSIADSFQVVATVAGGFVVNSLKDFAKALTQGEGAAGYFSLGNKLMTNNIMATSQAISGLGSVAETAGQIFSLAAKTPAGMVAGAAVSLLGSLAKKLGAQAEELAKFGLEILNDQVQSMVVTFQTYSKTGAVFANGLSDLGVIADASGVSIKNIAKFIANTAEQMVLFGGTVAGGAALMGKVNARFTELNDEGRSFRQQLSNLGYSIEDQMSITADYLEMLARGGRLRGKEDAVVAREAFEYAKSLKVISSITGEEAKQAQKRAKQALQQSYVQTKINQLGESAAAKFKLSVAGMPTEFQRAVQQMATDGFVTDPDAVIAMSQVPALQEMLSSIAAGIRNQSASVTDFTSDLVALKERLVPVAKAQVGIATEGIGFANLFKGSFAGVETFFQAVLNMGTAATEGGEAQKGAQTAVERAAVTTDKLTTAIGAAESEFEKMKRTLERDLTPAMESFATFVQTQITLTSDAVQAILKKLGIIEAGGPVATTGFGETGAGVATGRPVTAQSPVNFDTPEYWRRARLGLLPQNPTDRRLERGTQTTPAPAEAQPATTTTVPGQQSSINDPIVVATIQTNKNLEELIEQNRELIRLTTQTARALA